MPASSTCMIVRMVLSFPALTAGTCPDLDRLAPRQELDRRHDRQKADKHEHRELGQEGVVRPVIVGALLEKEHTRQADDEHQRRPTAPNTPSVTIRLRAVDWRQFLAYQHEVDRQRRDQGECGKMVKEGEKGRHASGPFIRSGGLATRNVKERVSARAIRAGCACMCAVHNSFLMPLPRSSRKLPSASPAEGRCPVSAPA